MREFSNKLQNFRFEDDDRNVYVNALKFAKKIKEDNIREIQIYLSDTFEFCVAFFGSMMAGLAPDILPKPIFSSDKRYVDSNNFASYIDADCNEEILLGEDCRFFLKTSGSSGESKRIEKKLLDMIAESTYLAKEFGFESDGIFFSSVSHQHMFGLTYKVFLPIILGAKVVSKEMNYPERILELDLKNHIFITSPVLLQALIKSPRSSEIRELKWIISAGSELKKTLREELTRLCNAKIVDIYGSTETGVVARNFGDGLRLFSAVKAKFDEREALGVSSPWCEFFQSNDWAEVSGDRLILKGRIDRIVKLNDKRVSLESIEKKLFESKILSDCYCEIHPNFKRLAALLVLNENGIRKFRRYGKKSIVAELSNILKNEFKNSVRYFKIVDSLPRNSQGKFAKHEFANVLFRSICPKWEHKILEDGKSKFSSVMSAELEIFTNHFPNLPLIPGFMQLDFVFELARSIGIDLSGASRIENLKYIKFVRPNDRLDIFIEKKENRVYFEIFCNDEKCSMGRVVY
ncbi:AMP-binding protein [Campylobacter sp. RM16187]|uniref:AMP-binding protein n=1 Tax=Campylobacter sp. RM16187 TaxID=1660063 RepID=UPI0021B5EBC0|nr:AMP-binding protein [Campylobacter sp. RM16187]QKG29159.1 acyl-CoA synthetase / AMP-(fatty) acid ligase [Campylobacter sp. RM16187]